MAFTKITPNPSDLPPEKPRYAGLYVRILANLIDTLIITLLILPIFIFTHNTTPDYSGFPPEFALIQQNYNDGLISPEYYEQQVIQYLPQILSVILPKFITSTLVNILIFGAIFIPLWKYTNSSPGKMLFGLKIVHADDLSTPSTSQYIIRFLGYIVSLLPLGLGYFIIGLNPKKRGLHDFMANTVVIYSKPLNPQWEKKKLKIQINLAIIMLIIMIVYFTVKN